jgi:sugar lactone lactonase YvrE
MTKIVKPSGKGARIEMEILSSKTRTIIEYKITLLFLLLSLVTGIILMGTIPSISAAGPALSHPQGVAVDRSGGVYVVDTGNHRIEKFKLANPCPVGTTQTDIGVCFVSEWGSIGSAMGEFNYPTGIEIDSLSDVYVADNSNHRVQKFSKDGKFILEWGSEGTKKGEFGHPSDTAVDPSGDVYVADTGNHRVQKFASDGTFINAWGSYGVADGKFRYPSSIAVDPSGDVYVADTGNNRIQKFKIANSCPSGTTQIKTEVCFVTAWDGIQGRGYGQFKLPFGVAVDPSGDVYVADNANHRIQKFKLADPCPAGTTQIKAGVCFISKLGSYGPRHGQFAYPNGLAPDTSGNIYVADLWNNRIEKFTNTGTYILTIPKSHVKVFKPVVTFSQKCVPNLVYYYAIGTKNMMGVESFYFDPWSQDMAIFIDGKEISYGKNIAIASATTNPPFKPGPHTVLAFVEIGGDPLQNHRLDPGELSATTTFTTC